MTAQQIGKTIELVNLKQDTNIKIIYFRNKPYNNTLFGVNDRIQK